MRRGVHGFTVLEVMLALALSAVVLSALLVIVQGVTATLRQAQALDVLSSTARHVQAELTAVAAIGGAQADPVTGASLPAVEDSRSGPAGDVLSLQAMTPRNCFDNHNPVRGVDGEPAWWLQRNVYEVRDGWRLVRSCFYGPVDGGAIRQLNAATLVEGVETLRLRFGIDTDSDRRLDRWVPANGWSQEKAVIGVRVGLVLATEHPVDADNVQGLSLFGQAQLPRDDGRARIAPTMTLPIRGRL
jgi:prepilin-type N-terminal cleavage/methylation domain-containing protein